MIKNHDIDLVTYQAIHHWLKKNFGKATKCENKDCEHKSQKFQWALKNGEKYDYKRENFSMLCRSCHAKHDFTADGIERLREANRKPWWGKKPINCRMCGSFVEKPYAYQFYCINCQPRLSRANYRRWEAWKKLHKNT